MPLAIKAIFYVPNTHAEKMQVMQEEMNMHLYSRKVLIKENCKELLPTYLRFIKGVVDCEDLPLNISRETYQDSSLIFKLKSVVTRRAIKMLADEMNRDPVNYDRWFKEFQQFIKEGILSDQEHQEALFKLCRYQDVKSDNVLTTLDEYIK